MIEEIGGQDPPVYMDTDSDFHSARPEIWSMLVTCSPTILPRGVRSFGAREVHTDREASRQC